MYLFYDPVSIGKIPSLSFLLEKCYKEILQKYRAINSRLYDRRDFITHLKIHASEVSLSAQWQTATNELEDSVYHQRAQLSVSFFERMWTLLMHGVLCFNHIIQCDVSSMNATLIFVWLRNKIELNS